MASTMDLLATCAFGLEAVVARELKDLGFDAKAVGVGRVRFAGDERALVDANLWLRSADRVLIRVGGMPVGAGDAGFDALFEGVRAMPWEEHIAPGAAFPVAGRCVRSAITSEPAVQRTVKRAIVERLRGAWGRSAGSVLDETGPRVAVEASLLNDEATLTIDTSGVGLHKRGYREGTPGEAALKETLAAGLVLLSVWRPGRPLVDPFCGSGTIAIEAALIGRNIAPGLGRSFDAEAWASAGGRGAAGKLIGADVWAQAREEARAAMSREKLRPTIHASDISDDALKLARANARAAGVEQDVHFVKRDFADLSSSVDYGVIVTNPPYGVRLGEDAEVERLYRSMPGVLRRLPTWSFHILTARLDLESLLGQEATRRRKIYNSRIECGFFTFLGPRPPGAASREDVPEAAEPVEAVDGAPGADRRPEPASRSSAPPSPASPPPAPAFGGLRERDRREAEEFRRCLSNTLRHLRKYPARGITCYRVYERDVPDVPLIVDRYEDRYHAVEYERRHSRTAAQQADWFDLMRGVIAEVGQVGIDRVFMKEKHRQRGLSQHEKQGSSGATRVVHEGGLKFEVNLSDYIDTGLFLDHRLTRGVFRAAAAGKRVLNLFCYTGSFTVYAAAGGAASTTSVDLSNTYLDWTRRNLTLNRLDDGLRDGRHRLIRSDVMAFLEASRREPGGTYDLAVVDPPTFSNSSSTDEDWDVQRGHGAALGLLAPLMSPGGVVYFSTNFRRFTLDAEGLARAGLAAREISKQTVPPEYRNRRIHRCWRLTAVGVEAALSALAESGKSGQPGDDGEADDAARAEGGLDEARTAQVREMP
jgi:23S rRNA (guanine2445-N2)-methyltransferase / 23S rRNA (guanine2069-N7)-methyltransferase